MPYIRQSLPQCSDDIFLTDGGIETSLIYQAGLDLPHFAAFDLMKTDAGCEALRNYYRPYLDIAVRQKTGFILESPTWRASTDWGARLGYSSSQLADANRRAIEMMCALREEYRPQAACIVVSGCVGPRGDGYIAGDRMSPDDAAAYHAAQVTAFRDAGADMVTGITMTSSDEALGLARTASRLGLPAVISFTVETDGSLPSGEPLGQAIEKVDRGTEIAPAYYMINCAHPEHFALPLAEQQQWTGRIRGVRANASRKSHAELDECTSLDDGDPAELAALYGKLRSALPHLTVLGGCCGTDHRHIAAISQVFA